MANQDYVQDCGFIKENTTEASNIFLNQNFFEIDFSSLAKGNQMVLDNTRYPERLGAYHSAPLILKIQITLEMNALRAYYNATITCKAFLEKERKLHYIYFLLSFLSYNKNWIEFFFIFFFLSVAYLGFPSYCGIYCNNDILLQI